jgi:hypothetical protein
MDADFSGLYHVVAAMVGFVLAPCLLWLAGRLESKRPSGDWTQPRQKDDHD